jgi:hypothetical protein
MSQKIGAGAMRGPTSMSAAEVASRTARPHAGASGSMKFPGVGPEKSNRSAAAVPAPKGTSVKR